MSHHARRKRLTKSAGVAWELGLDDPEFGLIPGMITPDAVLDHMNRVQTGVKSLAEDMAKYANTTGKSLSFDAAWYDWTVLWAGYYDRNKSWLARFLAPSEIDNEVTRYDQQLADFRQKFQIESRVEPSLPALPPGPAGDNLLTPNSPVLGTIRSVTIGAVALAALIAAAKIFGK